MKYFFINIGLFWFLLTTAQHKEEFTLQHREFTVPVSIIKPVKNVKNKGTILLLHGWNLPPQQWCNKSTICYAAANEGFTTIIPDFGKTTYHYQTYPETRKDYLKYPTRKWMYDSLIPYIQKKHKLLLEGENNFVAGISTGGRGAALFALEKPEIFKAAACLSADFDQTKIAGEPINTGFYGNYEKHKIRWETNDNIYNRACEFTVPLYLAHGNKDKVCPVSQTKLFYQKLKSCNKNIAHKLSIDENYGHDYVFWQKHSENIIRFFTTNCR